MPKVSKREPSLKPQQISDTAWYYEYRGHIEVLVEHIKDGARVGASLVNIPWHKLEMSMQRCRNDVADALTQCQQQRDHYKQEAVKLRETLRMLIREAMDVANDHHRPRYSRLDEALLSAQAVLKEAGDESINEA